MVPAGLLRRSVYQGPNHFDDPTNQETKMETPVSDLAVNTSAWIRKDCGVTRDLSSADFDCEQHSTVCRMRLTERVGCATFISKHSHALKISLSPVPPV